MCWLCEFFFILQPQEKSYGEMGKKKEKQKILQDQLTI